MKKIFVATSSFAKISNDPIDLLDKNLYKVSYNTLLRKLNERELIDFAKNADAIIAGTEKYSIKVFEKLNKLKVISRIGVGVDNIDLKASKTYGIKIYITHTTPAPAVAELTLGLLIDVARKISSNYSNIIIGKWNKQMGVLLSNKTLGIIGLGTVGKELVKLAKGFNFKLLAFDKYYDEDFAKRHNISYCDLNTLLNNADIISIHLNLSSETDQLINEKQISKMKKNSILLNTSRGEIVDEKALYNALKDEEILGAGLDVFKNEPYFGPLKELKNVILTPHVGSYAKEIRIQMEMEAVENVIRGLNEL